MALSRSLLECGHDEDRDDEVCSYCASDGKLQPALYFCFDCGVFGKYICDNCTKHHNKYSRNHEVEKIGNQSKSRRAKGKDVRLKANQQPFKEQEHGSLLTDINEVKNENEKLKRELNDYRKELQKANNELKKKNEGCKRKAAHKLIFKKPDDSKIRFSRQGEPNVDTCSGVEQVKKQTPLVVSIEIGNTCSTFAFSFFDEYGANPLKILNNNRWLCKGSVSEKNQSIVLFDENKIFHSFGFEAESKYEELVEGDEHHKWFFFKRFMLQLHRKEISKDFEISDEKGMKMKAIDVIGAAIRYLKDHFFALFKQRYPNLSNQDIHWVLTVPAIWTDCARQLMRESANQSDIKNAQLTIITEAQAACMYYKMLKQIKGLQTADISSPGTKFMVIDLGGFTADFTVFERQSDGRLTEIIVASGIACGGNMVVQEFHELIRSFTGEDIYQKWIDEFQVDFTYFQQDIVTKINLIRSDNSGNIQITFRVPVSLTSKLRENKDIFISEAESQFNGKIKWIGDKIRIDRQLVINLFKPFTDWIADAVKSLLKEPSVQGTNTFLMVGGFSGHSFIREAIINAFPTVNVIIPEEENLAVSKGAVIYGHQH